ncbi:MAG: hypothetical protein D6738_06920 [Acidobacteria bacterium]|nr:MAG: hypothetical protein D6738_06920 [Acidobacteriota bacterium]
MAGERQRLLQQAAAAVRRGDLAGAAELYRQLAELVPNDPAVLQRLGDALARIGRQEEARDALRRLARVYRSSGQTNHALAALRRAARVGGPSAELMEELGEACLEAGRMADARGPLLEASRLYAERRDLASARRTLERGASASPTDPTYLEALVALTDQIGAERDRAAARAALSVTRCRAGDLAGAVAAAAEALALDPQGEDVLEVLARAEAAFERHPEALPDQPPPGAAVPEGTWATFRARCLVGRPDTSQAVLDRLESVLDGEHAPAGHAALVAAALLAEADRHDAADRAARIAVRDLGRSRRFAGQLRELLERLTTLDAERFAWAAQAAGRLAGAATHRTGAIPVPGTGPVAVGGADLPDEIRARLFEAEALLQHGLADTARRALRAIPARFQEHPDVLRVFGAAGMSAEAPAPQPVVVPDAPAPAPEDAGDQAPPIALDAPGAPSAEPDAPPARPAGTTTIPAPRRQGPEQESSPAAPPAADAGEDFVIVFDDEAGEGVTAPPAGFEDVQQAAGGDAPVDGPDLRALEEGIGRAMSEADAETSYQMALGLVEMGLFGQARPVLESLLAVPERAASAGMLLVRGFREQDAPAEALAAGLRALEAGEGVVDPARGQLAVELAELALAAGRRDEARRLAGLIQRFEPGSPLLARLAPLAAADS